MLIQPLQEFDVMFDSKRDKWWKWN